MNPEEILTPAFRQWADAAKYSITSRTDDDRVLVWTSGGEIRLFISANSDGWWAVDSSDRMQPERFDWAAAYPGLIERSFVATFLERVRELRGLGALQIAGKGDQLPSGMSLGRQQFRGSEYPALIDADGKTRAVSAGGRILSSLRLGELAALAVHDVDAIVAAFLNPQGVPLFSLR